MLEPVASEAVLADGLFDSGLIGAARGRRAGARVVARARGRAAGRGDAAAPHALDAAVELFGDVAVLRDPTYGVAPWNLDEREIAGARTFRFAGLDPASPHTLDGRRVEGRLAELCEDYAARLRAAGWVARGEDAARAARARSPTACRSTTRCAT